MKPISTPRFLRHLQLIGGIVPRSNFVLPNGNGFAVNGE